MIMKRCDRGHYYDGEIYNECPDCKGIGQNPYMQMQDMFYGDDYADEDSVTVALPRSKPQGGRASAFDDDPVTAALPRPKPQGRRASAFDDDSVTIAQPRPKPQGRTGSSIFDDDSVTVAQPRPKPQGRSSSIFDDDPVTAAQPRKPAAGAAHKPGLKPVVGWLVCIRGSDFGSSFTIKLGKNFIGRAADMDIVLQGDDSIAMEKHAAVYYVPKQRRFAVEPGTSGKLFYLNRNAIMRPVWMKQHDILTIGNFSLMFFPCCGEHFSWEEIIRKRREQSRNR